MARGASDIPELKLVVLQKLIESFKTSPNLKLMTLFGTINADSDEIKWESQTGNRGMTPFVARNARAPSIAPEGVAEHQAFAAFWKEKIYFDEYFLNNLRKPGTQQTYDAAQRKLAAEMRKMRNRSDRRREWMFAQMLTAGSFSYTSQRGIRISVDYGLPSSQVVTLASDRKWSTGANKNILEDIFDAKLTLQNNIGAEIDYAIFPSEVLKYMIFDTGIQNLLKKSAYGDGDLFTRTLTVLGSLLDIKNMVLYDEQYEITGWLTAGVTADSTTTVYVDDASDFEEGETLRFVDVSANTWEEETISSVDVDAGTITVAAAPSTSYKAGEDKVVMKKKFIPTNKFCMFASTVEGESIAEFMQSPFGLNRHYGMYVDTHEEWDPDGVWVRTQNMGLPVLYNRDAIYVLTVA